jgi:hypothetical protein
LKARLKPRDAFFKEKMLPLAETNAFTAPVFSLPNQFAPILGTESHNGAASVAFVTGLIFPPDSGRNR